MADSDDESSVASEDWHHEFDDYHSQAAADIYKMIYKSWPKRGHSWNRDRHVQFYAAVSSMLRHSAGPDHESAGLPRRVGRRNSTPTALT